MERPQPLPVTPINQLVKDIGEKNTRKLLGVHRSTLYKWRSHGLGYAGRNPDHTTLRLARLYLYLLSLGWTLEQLVYAVEDIEDALEDVVEEQRQLND